MDPPDGKALVLLSGGLDSATCLYWAKKRFGNVYAITFDYHGRLQKEKASAELLSRAAGVDNLLSISLPFLKEASAAGSDPLYKHHVSQSGDSRWDSYIPARNMLFYSIAAYHAEYLGIDAIIGGHNAHDASFFRDSTPDYIRKMNSLLAESCLMCRDKPYKIMLPLAEMDRKMIIRLAAELGVPLHFTWSCHNDGELPCGLCYACIQRTEAFEALGIEDPLHKARSRANYASEPSQFRNAA